MIVGLLLLNPIISFSQEKIDGFNTTTDLPVLNEELRKLDSKFSLPSGAMFFMPTTKSCPSGSTDITTANADKFMKINATAGTGGSSNSTVAGFNVVYPDHQHGQNSAGYATQDLESAGGLGMAANGTAGQNILRLTGLDTGYGTYLVRTGTDTSGGATVAVAAQNITITPSFMNCRLCQVN